MAKFMDVHNGFVGVTAEQLREAHQRDLPVEVDQPGPALLDARGMAAGWPVSRRAIQMMNYYVYLALARGRSNALLREAETAPRAELARLYRPRPGASGASGSPRRRLFGRLRPAFTAWTGRAGRPGRAAGRRVVLRDGSEVVIRQVRSSDGPLLADGFARLGPESRRLRFLRRKDELTPAELRYFTDVDHHDHEALGALAGATGGGVGIARYVRDASDPHSAEIALTVVDDWQGRGLGTELLAQLSGRARAAGIRRFTALVSADNAAMTALLRRLCADPVRREYGTVEWEITLVPSESPCAGLLASLPG
jgi:RimJ/RimL family protein N-acetyltransferase